MATIFTKIIDGELPAHFVWEDVRCVAFLSINPISAGHSLVVPREEVDHWIDASPDLLGHLMGVGREIGEALQRSYRPQRIGMMIAGFEVPHLHLHVLPVNGLGDLSFANAARHVAPHALAGAAATIRAALRAAGASGVPAGPEQ